MATGLPVISTLHAGIPELVEDGEQGFLIAEGDVGAYVDRLEWDLDVGERARARVVEHFNLTREVRKLGDIYARLIENAPLSAASRERLPDTGR